MIHVLDFISFRAIEQTFQIENQYLEYKTICNALIAHLQRLTITPNHTGAIPDLDEDVSPSTSATNLDPAPLRSESAPMIKPGEFLRREKDDVLVPSRTTLTRKRSKKEKRITIKVCTLYVLGHAKCMWGVRVHVLRYEK